MQAILAVDTKRAGELLSLSERTVQRLIRANRIRAVRTTRRVIVPLTALEEFLQAPAHPGPTKLKTEKIEAGQ
jgi:excisionase family DNA binding protein